MVDAGDIDDVRAALRQSDRGLFLAPIRHHSPACAWAVRELIRDVKPDRVLIEAPIDLEAHIDILLDKETKPPVAIAAIVEQQKDARLAAYYPFCTHSPEYVALVEGKRIGAGVGFMDLPSADKAMSSTATERPSLVVEDEAVFESGDYINALCRELGCRDGFELWDHLFESRLGQADWQDLLADIGSYCAAIRAATPEATIESSGDAAREAHMLAVLEATLEEGSSVVVVAGGFHVPALVTAGQGRRAKAPKAGKDAAKSYLIRYGFGALDALNGYGAGLLQPDYYDYLWQRANAADGELPWRQTALDLISEFGEHLQSEGHRINVPAQVEIIRVAEGLAAMRGRPGAGRHDLIDAVRTALVKEEVGAREIWTERLLSFLCGTAIGNVPASAGSPPIVEDARRRARENRIDVSDGARRRRKLDIRRKPAHLEASRFFRAMVLLESGFAELETGPDYLNGVNIGRLFEEWSYAWSPRTEGRLIELAVYGDNVADACLHLLESKREDMREHGRGRDISAIAGLFVEGILAGLGTRLGPFLELLSSDIQASTDFELVVNALRRLHYIAQASGPLGIPGQLNLDEVQQIAYHRLVYLCDDLPSTGEDQEQSRMEALRLTVELLRDPASAMFDHNLFDAAIDRVADANPPPQLLGAILAICVQAGRREATDLCSAIEGSYAGTVDEQRDRIGVLRGMLYTAPELIWTSDVVLEVVDKLLTGMSESEFLEFLPHIRLAFTALNPREADKLAGLLADVHGGRITDFTGHSSSLTATDLGRGIELEQTLRNSLEADGLSAWLEVADE